MDPPAQAVRRTVEDLYRAESRRVFATLIRLLGDFDLAEEALHDAFQAALVQWRKRGLPKNPRAWLISTGRFKAIDALRRRARFETVENIEELMESLPGADETIDDTALEDDR